MTARRTTSRTIIRMLAGVAFIALAAGTSVPTADAETLREALAAAYQGNPTLLARRAELRALDEGVPQALSGWRPTVTANAQLSHNHSRSVSTGSGGIPASTFKGNSFEKSVGVTITQPLFRGFRTLAGTNQAENLVQAGRADLHAAEQDVLLAAVTAYMNVVRDQAVLDLNVNNVQVLARQLEATRDRFEVGEVTRTDVAQAESRVARAIADRVRAEGDLESSRANYVNIIGSPPEAVSQPAAVVGLPTGLDDVKSTARIQNPSVIAATYRERAASDNVQVIEGELWPEINLFGEYSRGWDPTFSTSESERSTVGALISIPIYQAGAVTSRVRQAKQVVSQRRIEIAEAQRSVIEEATQAWETLVSAQAQVTAFEEEARSTEIALDGVEQEAQAGLRTVLDVLDAEQEYLDARVNLVSAMRDEVVASYALLAAVGGLTAGNLGLAVETYDPSLHYHMVRNKVWGLGDDPIQPVAE